MTYDYKKMKEIKERGENITPHEARILAHVGLVTAEWAMKWIEQAQDGDVAWAACIMAIDKFATAEWAMRQIERGIGDVEAAVEWMVGNRLASQEWADEIIRKHKKGE